MCTLQGNIMDEKTLDELLQFIGKAFYEHSQGRVFHPQAQAIYEWMKKNAPQHLKS